MKTLSRTYAVYRLDELPVEIRSQVLDRERAINVSDEEWYTPVVDGWQGRLAGLGYEDARIFFSGFWSQGDGACFEARMNLDLWLGRQKLGRTYQNAGRACRTGGVELHLKHSGRYCHEYSVDLETSYDGSDDAVAAELEAIEPVILEEVRGLSKEIYRELEREYEKQTSDEAVADTLRINEWEFLADGRPATVIELVRSHV